jgi:LysR family transcriptional regulator, glycine cleavage system transcriptional activator
MTEIPPLRAIHAFEALGRRGSVTAAAEDLAVSPGAITQQIHILEKFLNVRLVQRHGRGIELTSWGKLYLSHVLAAMDLLRLGGQDLARARRSNHLGVSVLPSLANKWLGPLLFEWKRLHPEANIMLEGVDPEPRLDEGTADFRISYGGRQRSHQRFTHLFTDFLIPVGSPSLLGRHPPPIDPHELLKFPLLWIDWGPEFVATPTWRDWFSFVGVSSACVRCDLTFSLSSAAIDAATESRGLVLAQHSMVASALNSGSLVRLSDRYLLLPESYFVAWGSAALDKTMGAAFHSWLQGEARRFDAPT